MVDVYGESIYLSVSSKDSSVYFRDNSAANFRVKLAKRLELIGCWKIALCEISLSNVIVKAPTRVNTSDDSDDDGTEAANMLNDDDDTICIHCSVCTGLIVNGKETRVLRTLPLKKNQYKIYPIQYYLPLETRYIDTIEFHIDTSSGKPVTFDKQTGQTSMTLRLKKC
jgi:hypothetical protein